MRPYKDAEGELAPARVQQVRAETTSGLDIRWFSAAPDLSESLLGCKNATQVKARIDRFGLATVVGGIQPRGCIMAGEAPEPPWVWAHREKHAAHKALRREGAAEVNGV